MRLIKILAATSLLCPLMACSASTKFVASPPSLSHPPGSFEMDCADPVQLPNGPMKQRDVERHWSRDRASLIECGDRHAALRDFYQQRDGALRAKP